jgi:glycosyltransferase involved in cell wall biosynthesis
MLAAMLASVVIRSYRRPDALKELVQCVRKQRGADFEIVILEQSNDPALVEELRSYGDARIRVVTAEPMNPPAARNEAIRYARGEILIFIDDDDLPVGDTWIADHLRNYENPSCMGVVGRLVADPNDLRGPHFARILRKFALRQTFFKDTVVLAHNTLFKDGIDFLIGSNASVRRSLVDRIGGWDEGIPMNEEQSFAIKFLRERAPEERFVFDPRPIMWRRTDIAGGLNRRGAEDWHLRELEARLFYYEHVVGHYFPTRYRLLKPLFWLRGVEQVFVWIWDPDNAHHPLAKRLRATVELMTELPRAVRANRFPADEVRRVPHLKSADAKPDVAPKGARATMR